MGSLLTTHRNSFSYSRQATTEAKKTEDLHAQSPRGEMSRLSQKERKHWLAVQRGDCLEGQEERVRVGWRKWRNREIKKTNGGRQKKGKGSDRDC